MCKSCPNGYAIADSNADCYSSPSCAYGSTDSHSAAHFDSDADSNAYA